MDGASVTIPRQPKTLEAQRVVPVFVVVLAVIAAVAVFDLILVRIAARHRTETGTRSFERGVVARRENRTAEALELFRTAYNHNPRNPEYHLAFAQALTAAGRAQEGRAALEQLLIREPAYGPANAAMARVLRSDDWEQAAWYYHRALYGEWKDSPDLRALRFELADLLAQHQAREPLASEVALLNADPMEPSEAVHLGRLQLAAGEWERAEQLYRSLLDASPNDPQFLAGLARAQFGSGKYLAAERAFRRAVAGGAGGTAAQELMLVARINELDPTLRRLAPAEKHRRAHELTGMLLAVLQQCSAKSALVEQAGGELKAHESKRNYLALAEADLDLFERLWNSRGQVCGAAAKMPAPLELLAVQLTR